MNLPQKPARGNPMGWYFGLPYIKGSVLRPSKPGKIPDNLRGKSAIFCDEKLLEARNWPQLIADWLDSLAYKGVLILWVPDVRYREPAPGHQRVTLEQIVSSVTDLPPEVLRGLAVTRIVPVASLNIGAPHYDVLEADVIDGHAFVVIEKTHCTGARKTPWRKKPKHMAVCRWGANGDALMASSVLPALKAEGWTITMMVRETGAAMLKHDPHIDEFLVFNPEALLVAERDEFWSAWALRFDRIVNLSDTVENILLKKAEEGDFYWPQEQRRAMCGGSYLAATHKAAQVPGPYRVKFYPSEDEAKWAQSKRAEFGPFILWSLQGGAVHKWWPYAPQAICQLLLKTDYTFVFTGDAIAGDLADKVAQAAMDYHFGDLAACQKRLKNMVSVKTLREACALAQVADIVVGPETALTNAVSLEIMPKVVILSHSAPSNLTDDWVNTIALKPTSPCWPCHRLHESHQFCPQDAATEAAACAASITVPMVVEAVMTASRMTSSKMDAA